MAGPKGLTYFTYFIQLLQSNSHILTLGRGNGFLALHLAVSMYYVHHCSCDYLLAKAQL